MDSVLSQLKHTVTYLKISWGRTEAEGTNISFQTLKSKPSVHIDSKPKYPVEELIATDNEPTTAHFYKY